MIEKIKSFKTTDGEIHATIEQAQGHELQSYLQGAFPTDNKTIADFLLSNKAHFIDLLTMKATSKPAARKVNGGTKKRTAKPAEVQPAAV